MKRQTITKDSTGTELASSHDQALLTQAPRKLETNGPDVPESPPASNSSSTESLRRAVSSGPHSTLLDFLNSDLASIASVCACAPHLLPVWLSDPADVWVARLLLLAADELRFASFVRT